MYGSLAVDGNMGTLALQSQCAITNNETYPWLAVDLGVATYVWGVNFTSRGDGNNIRMFRLYRDMR